MSRTTTLLVVATLLGSPAGSLVCELWCVSPAAEGHHRAIGCHHAATPATTHQQIVSMAGCHAPELPLFLSEARPTDMRMLAIACAFGEPPHLVLDGSSPCDYWRVLHSQPLGPPSPQVLRI